MLATVLGSALAVTGIASVVTAILPWRQGNVDWEFGAFGEVAASLGLPFLGLALLAVVAIRSGRGWARSGTLLGLAALTILCLLGLFLVATDIPLILGATRQMDPANARSVKIVLSKTVILSSLYAVASLWTMGIVVRTFGRTRG